MQGLMLSGQCLGVMSTDRTFTDKQTGVNRAFTDNRLGIQFQKVGGFQGEYDTHSISLSKSQVDSGLVARFNDLKQKLITVPVYVHVFTSLGGRTGFELKLSGDGFPIED